MSSTGGGCFPPSETLCMCSHNVPVKFQCEKCIIISLNDRIKDLEESYQGLSAELRYVIDRLALSAPMKKMWLEEFKKDYPDIVSSVPYKCPACDGYGIRKVSDISISVGIPRVSSTEAECKPCEGKGILWG